MNLPNLITTARLVFTVGVFVCLEASVAEGGWRFAAPDSAAAVGDVNTTLVWVAFALFMVAAVTDFLDGYLARRWQMVTAFGRVADPFADKVLIAGTLITLLQFKAAHAALTTWYVVIVVAREFLVTSIRALVEASGKPFPADRLGKWKMVSQCWTCAALLTMVAGSDFWVWAAIFGFWVSLVLTLVSGLNYVWKARGLLFAEAAG